MGLTFVSLPCFVFQVLFVRLRAQLIASPSNLAMKTAFCALRPFSVAFTRLEVFRFFLKKLLFNGEVDRVSYEKAEDVFTHIEFAVLFEVVLKSTPQFIIQLYAISLQEEPGAIIQIISPPISFLILAWAPHQVAWYDISPLMLHGGSSSIPSSTVVNRTIIDHFDKLFERFDGQLSGSLDRVNDVISTIQSISETSLAEYLAYAACALSFINLVVFCIAFRSVFRMFRHQPNHKLSIPPYSKKIEVPHCDKHATNN